MKQLSGLDASFLYLESPQMPMHVGALHVFELPAGFRGRFATALRRHVASRLPALPALRRRLWWMPLNIANPAWVDAEPDLKHHIVEIALPRGAGIAELEAQVARLHAVLLDRARPLWKFHVFEGLAPSPDGHRRVAMYTQLHHAAVDGQAAVALANALLDVTPEPREIEPRPSSRAKVFKLGMTEMLRGVVGRQAQQIAGIVRELPSTVGTLKDFAAAAVAGSPLLSGTKGSGNVALAPRTVLNASVTAARAFATVTLPLSELREVGRAHGATVNDVVLMVCGSALRRYFARRRTLPRKSLIAAVPITLRAKGDTTADNQASMSLVSLGTHIADPMQRFVHVRQAGAAMKQTMGSLKGILPTDFPSLGMPWLIEAAAALYGKAKVAERLPQLANLTISNVPGPEVPLYLAGARMLTNHPASIVVHGLALNITVQSCHDSLDFGLMADAQAMPDVRELADAIRIAYDDVKSLPRPGEDDQAPSAAAVVVAAAQRVARGAGRVAGKAGKVAGKVAAEVARKVAGNVAGKVAANVAGAVVGSAFDAAVSQAARRARGAVARPPRRR